MLYQNDNNNNNNNNNNNRCRTKCCFVKEALIKLLFILRFNRTCLKPQKNYAVASPVIFEIVCGFSIDKEVSSACCEDNMN